MPAGRVQLIQDILGSAHIFSSAVDDLMRERLHAVIGEQLTFSQLKLLKLIARSETSNVTRVAGFLGVSSAAASKAVDRLVRRDLLCRTEAEGDRRAVALTLTAEGERLLDEYEKVTNQTLEEIFGEITPDGLREAADRLDQLSLRLVEHDFEAGGACFRCGIYFRDKCLLRAQRDRICHFHSGHPAADEPADRAGEGNGFSRDRSEGPV